MPVGQHIRPIRPTYMIHDDTKVPFFRPFLPFQVFYFEKSEHKSDIV